MTLPVALSLFWTILVTTEEANAGAISEFDGVVHESITRPIVICDI